MSEQKKLGDDLVERISIARAALFQVNWQMTSEGFSYWQAISNKLNNKAIHGTSDGKPYVEPPRWRVPTDEDAKARPKCRVRDLGNHPWREATLLYVQQVDCDFPFVVTKKDGRYGSFRYCEILDTPDK